MTRNLITIRTYPGGDPASGVGYEVRRHSDDALLSAPGAVTDANGQFSFNQNLSPGPFYWKATDSGPTPPAVRKGSTKTCDSGGAFSIAEMPYAMRAMGTAGVVRGFLNELAPSAGSGINYTLDTGAAAILGIPAVVSTKINNQAVTNARDATNPRACYMCLQATGLGQTEEGKVVLTDLCGAAAASPALPNLASFQSETSWALALASFILPPTGGGSVLTSFVNLRSYLLTRNPQAVIIARRLSQTAQPVNSTSGVDVVWDDGSTSFTLANGVPYDIVSVVSLAVKAPVGQTISLAPYINGVGNIATFLPTSTSSDFVTVANSHVLGSVIGTGAPTTCSVRVKVSGGTGNYLTGSLLVTATPRR